MEEKAVDIFVHVPWALVRGLSWIDGSTGRTSLPSTVATDVCVLPTLPFMPTPAGFWVEG